MAQFRLTRALICLVLMSAFGCSNANLPLNKPETKLEDRAKNGTRSAVFAEVTLPGDGTNSGQLSSPHAVTTSDRSAPIPADQDGFFVGLALSGGGSRSANFSAACMFQLEKLGLLKHVDYISSVSGGSLAGALYCTSDDNSWNPAAVQKQLTYPFARDLIFESLLPWSVLAFAVTDWDRSDVLAGVFRDRLFNRNGRPLTYTDLRSDRPRLLINATDMQTGRRFVFCNESFDQVNSDLTRYPLAYAVAASSAFPVVLHPVTLRDYSTTFPQYLHLIDGGVADNLGIQTLVETYASQVDAAARHGLPDPYPRGAVFVIVSAQTRFNAKLSEQSDLGLFSSITNALGLTGHTLVGRASSATLAETIVNNAPDDATAKELREYIHQLDTRGYVQISDKTKHPVHVLFISLSLLEGMKNLPFENFSEAVNSIDTYFNIKPGEAYSLYQAADLLVNDKLNEDIRAVVKEIESPKVAEGNPKSETRPKIEQDPKQ